MVYSGMTAGARGPTTAWRRMAILAACGALSVVGLVARGSPAHTGAMFMAYLDGLIEGQHANAPNLGVDPGSGPLVVTTSYAPDENATVQHAAASFSTDVPSLQRHGVELIAFLVAISR